MGSRGHRQTTVFPAMSYTCATSRLKVPLVQRGTGRCKLRVLACERSSGWSSTSRPRQRQSHFTSSGGLDAWLTPCTACVVAPPACSIQEGMNTCHRHMMDGGRASDDTQ